ncbi:TIGR02646 family protein [Pluralibacter gergoviae]|uniref:retron system putative HNH endonuclease n=1 Tax=Pluralibacter gergoviae TaxID=61647 RepID=UPI0006523A70|nr:retron system putative HNH endonuclease [Pluralibacter gergoviae]EKV0928344.1 TIGR02646 family protein [Pluralibacter gergoviae]ELD4269607.1 TIGR02646 family protein [Pluralibacter gergoviae]ELD4275811.1 TIGR02646 family protein [Pluralibacter gergoviae]ELD4299814.1 TIGR02646 family protein [Pluralibacter gergoviae]ELD4314650.1 TIGR02646 family protein [Pluralibacter gergoviae]
MKFLTRDPVGPEVLAEFDYNIHDWNAFKRRHKQLVWVDLVKMQGKRCAYCERKIDIHNSDDKHIEHFLRRCRHRHLTFEWSNLFGSCAESKHCGFYKDEQNYQEQDLIKADSDDPTYFFHFGINGNMDIRSGLSRNDQRRAEVTIRVFNLNGEKGGVKTERINAISETWSLIEKFISIAEEFIEEGLYDDSVRNDLRDEYYKEIDPRPFSTALRDVFDTMLP